MEHLLLFPVSFPGEKTLVSRPGAAPRLPDLHGSRLPHQKGSLRAEDFGVSVLRSRATCLFCLQENFKGNNI